MRAYALRLLVLSSLSALFACTGELSGGSEGPAVEITVAPLTLPGVLDVEYALAVFNASPTTSTIFDADGTVGGNIPDLVWEQDSLTSTRFGNGAGGDISYVGPCDASLGGASTNYVALALKTVKVANGQGSYPVGDMNLLDDQNTVSGGIDPQSADTDADFDNPCPYNDPCVLPVPCVENQDTPVTFNLTILRDANQGFFDIAVNFEDIFCSAKLDCQYPDGPIELLHDPTDPSGGTGQTAVLAFVCTSGPGATSDTLLHMGPITVTCGDDAPILINPTSGPGNAYTATTPDPDPSDPVWQYATYMGTEDLNCGSESCNKVYWNTAIGFDPSADDCHIMASATASTLDQMGDDLTPPATAYPWIAYDVALTASGGGLVCDRNALNAAGSGVATEYTDLRSRKSFCYDFDGVQVRTGEGLGCLQPTGYFALGAPQLHADLNLVESGYCAPSADEWGRIDHIERWATHFADYYRNPEVGVEALDVSLDSPIVRGYFDFAMREHYKGIGRQPAVYADVLAVIPFIYDNVSITDPCEEAGRMAGLGEIFASIARQPEARSDLLNLATYAGNLAAQSDPKVVVARAVAVGDVIASVARATELLTTLRQDALDLLGGYVAPVGTGSGSAAILARATSTEAVLEGISRQPGAATDLVGLAEDLMSDQAIPFTGPVGDVAIARVLEAFDVAVSRQPEARDTLAAALLQLTGVVAPPAE